MVELILGEKDAKIETSIKVEDKGKKYNYAPRISNDS